LATYNPPLVILEPEEITEPLKVITKPADTVEEERDNVGLLNASAITLNCNLLVPSSKTKCGLVFEVVPDGNIITFGIMLIYF
jgi:hypothetical protein